jgi:glutamate-1-semialdehyde 2,1-aminomutase
MTTAPETARTSSLQDYVEQYRARTRRSEAIWSEARTLLPGGVAGAAGFLAPRPIYLEKAKGGKLYDVDGNEYVDLLLGGFTNILGHSPEPVVAAVKRQLDLGTSAMLFNETGIDLVKLIQRHQPHIEMLRFANSGTEATMFALRVARSFTKREKMAKPEGGYNGQHDWVLMSGTTACAGPDSRPQACPESAGIPSDVPAQTVVFPWNDTEASVSIIEENARDLAAVIVEPLPGFGMGAISPQAGYLEAIREVTARHGILLIYDEIAIGFRVGGMVGAARYYGVIPDLSCFGKVIGGGFPVGAFGGRADIMEKTLAPSADPEYKVFQSGSFTGNAITVAAGLACLEELESRDFAYIDTLADKIKAGLTSIAGEKGHALQMTGEGSIFYPHFNDRPVRNMRDKRKDDAAKNRLFCMGLIAHGVYMPPGHAAATCFAHTEADIDRVLEVSEAVMGAMQA